jgi:hypothetical protein
MTEDMQSKPPQSDKCKWHIDGESFFVTECGHAFEFNEAGPVENGFRFCPYCGKQVESSAGRAK